jgi:hypothetical protein
VRTRAASARQMDALSQWLEGHGLQRYAEVFVENDVDFDAIRLLSDSDLEKLGISLGHRRKLLRAIDELNSRSALIGEGRCTRADALTLRRANSELSGGENCGPGRCAA